ncbi:MAG TPA: hypothetical protein VMU83_17085 [Hanamia sp.]|nr:hypothetical protein [Hanamia sp.]
MDELFEEHQHQRRILPWSIVTMIWTLSILHLSKNGISKEYIIFDILILIALPLMMTVLFFVVKLSIVITKNCITDRMYPFHLRYKKIRPNHVKSVFCKEYNKNRMFQGWGLGISFNGKYRSYTIKGYKGIELNLKSGKTVFICSTKSEELFSTINDLLK